MKAKQKVTWDCIWFGSYPQSEVTGSDVVHTALQKVKEKEWSNNEIWINGNQALLLSDVVLDVREYHTVEFAFEEPHGKQAPSGAG